MTGAPLDTTVFIAGGGPAGLTAAWLLSRRGVATTVVDAHPSLWGGIARTEEYKGYRFDIGGHRFFSKSAEIERLWDEILPEPMLQRPRKSRIHYRGRFFSYPIQPLEALRRLGAVESAQCVASFLAARARPRQPVRTFEDWVTNAFGSRLYGMFFKTYTEKVWGMDCRDISADWAAQRIKGLSLGRALWDAVGGSRLGGRNDARSLIRTFRYPRLGPGMMWEAAAEGARSAGAELVQGATVESLDRDGATGRWSIAASTAAGLRHWQAESVVSSIPLHSLVTMLTPSLSDAAVEAGQALRYRDFLTVALVVRERQVFDDNWIYVHDPSVRVGRIQNFKSWSPALVPDAATTCYGLEYFCTAGDDLWGRADADLVALAGAELEALGLAKAGDVLDGTVVRQPRAYPVYDAEYERNVAIVRDELQARYPTLHQVGRNGMHMYNNQDHAMMTAVLTVENIVAGRPVRDPWLVNQDAEYHEAGERGATGVRAVPRNI